MPRIETTGSAGTVKARWHIRPADAHDPDAGADQHEREQRADARHLADDVSGQERREQRREDEEQHVRLLRRLELRMQFGEDLRHQAVVAHRVEDARLPVSMTRITDEKPARIATVTNFDSHS